MQISCWISHLSNCIIGVQVISVSYFNSSLKRFSLLPISFCPLNLLSFCIRSIVYKLSERSIKDICTQLISHELLAFIVLLIWSSNMWWMLKRQDVILTKLDWLHAVCTWTYFGVERKRKLIQCLLVEGGRQQVWSFGLQAKEAIEMQTVFGNDATFGPLLTHHVFVLYCCARCSWST